MRRLIAIVIILLSTLFLQGGCATYKAYPGDKLPKSEVALLDVPWTNIVIDGSQIPDKYVTQIELLPGIHTIEWEYIHTNEYLDIKRLEFEAEPNHQYQLGQRFFSADGFDGVIGLVADLAADTALFPLKLLREESQPTEAPAGEFYMWITDRGSQEIVAGMAPNIVQSHQEITYVPIDEP